MNIIRLTSENIKRLQAVEINPQGNVIVIGGKNGAGKSSVLDSIQYALGGDPTDRMPVRRGEERAKIVVDLGDLVVKRTFTAAGGTSLVVTDADGLKQSSPQTILDKLTGKLTFDPLEFSRQKPDKQAEILRGLVGLDFTEHDRQREILFAQRTNLNREAKTLQARIASMPFHKDAPDAEVSSVDVLSAQVTAAAANAKNQEVRNQAANLEAAVEQVESTLKIYEKQIAGIEAQIDSLMKQLSQLKTSRSKALTTLAENRAEAEKVRATADALQDIDLSPFKDKLASVEAGNRRFQENLRRAEVVKQFKEKSEEAETLTRKIESMDADKRRKSTTAKYPIDGLLFDTAGGVMLNGIPFEQCSSAEQLRVSVAIGLALNPTLKILLIRDGSLLDQENMKLLLEMATAANAQVWIERVGTDEQTSVVIEDGMVADKD